MLILLTKLFFVSVTPLYRNQMKKITFKGILIFPKYLLYGIKSGFNVALNIDGTQNRLF